ncbi:MAG: biotin--[acetyl-CoA-carboxylase] ligase [Novosphingobium sp.]|nr:biotin--[acetyl-CoA-carboxylase] ligase [Novosphingobium sp.]
MIEVLKEAGSTNAELMDRLSRGERVSEGDWLVADRQVAGRGRQGREWLGGAGNFMGSTVVHIGHGDPDLATLSLVTGLAVREAIAAMVPSEAPPMLKWPNDLLIDGAKLCGILLERTGDAVVVGVGVNLAIAPQVEGRRTIALANICEAVPDRDVFAQAVARQFDMELDRWRSFGTAPMINRWQAAAHPVGTHLAVDDCVLGRIEGSFAGLANDGGLQLRLPDGTTKTIHAGEVHFAQS